MRILHINAFDHAGGAARAAFWLHSGLRKAGAESMLLVQHQVGTEASVITTPGRSEMLLRDIRWILDAVPLLLYPRKTLTHWTVGWTSHRLRSFIKRLNPDIIHLHWLCRGMLPVRETGRVFALGKPVVWTLHDSWPFTGGCHVPGTCQRYRNRCGRCPQLGSALPFDLSRLTLSHKLWQWRKGMPVLITPSQWMADCAQASALFSRHRIVRLANGIDTDVFTPIDKKLARSVLNLPDTGKRLLLCGAMNAFSDPNKGYHLFRQSVDRLIALGWGDKIELIVFGASEPAAGNNLPLTTHYLGVLHDDAALRLAYSSADLFIMPSLQENLPNSILESLACLTPVVAFAAGGIPEMLEHRRNGYLAQPFEIEDLVQGILWALEDKAEPGLADQFTQPHAVQEHLALYRELLQR